MEESVEDKCKPKKYRFKGILKILSEKEQEEFNDALDDMVEARKPDYEENRRKAAKALVSRAFHTKRRNSSQHISNY